MEKAQAEGSIGNVTPEMENRWDKWIKSEFRHIDFLCEHSTCIDTKAKVTSILSTKTSRHVSRDTTLLNHGVRPRFSHAGFASVICKLQLFSKT